MLAVLSEINCLDKLNSIGVYPDQFYTDVEFFKNSSISFRDTTVIVIFAGSCSFNKKHTIELIKNLQKRAESEDDNGISGVHVISDTDIPNLDYYYKYCGDLEVVDVMQRNSVLKSNVSIWGSLKSDKKDTKIFLSDYDTGNSDKARKNYESRFSTEDEYIKLIHIPDVKKMLSMS